MLSLAPSALSFASGPADFAADNNIELALDGDENLDIRLVSGTVFAMGIDFDDLAGGQSHSTFTVTALNAGVEVGQFSFRAPDAPQENFIGLWSPLPFDQLQIRELPNADENEYFGAVFTSGRPAQAQIFGDGFEGP